MKVIARRVAQTSRGQAKRLAVAVAVFLISLVGTTYVSQQVFEGIPHLEDEVSFLFQAKTLASGRLYVATPEHLEFFNLPFLIDRDGRWFGKYPPGHPAVLAVGAFFGYPWLVNPLASSLALVFVYLLGIRLYGEGTAIIAAALGIVSPFFLLQSGTLLSHPTTLLFITLFLYLFLRSNDERSGCLAMLAGACLGMGFLARQLTAVGMAVPFVTYALWQLARAPRQHFARYALLIAGFAPFLGALLIYNALLTGSPFTSPYELYWPFDKIGFGEGVGAGGYHTLASGLINTRMNLESLSSQLFGWPLRLDLVFVVLASLVLAFNLGKCALQAVKGITGQAHDSLRRTCLWDALLLTSFTSLVAVHVLYWTSGGMYGPRYYFEAMPALLLLSARGIAHLAIAADLNWAGRHEQGLVTVISSRPLVLLARLGPAGLIKLAIGVAVAALVICSLTSYLPRQFATYRGWYGITGDAPRLASQLQCGRAIVFVPPGNSWTDHAPLIGLNSPALDTEVIFALDLGQERNQVLIEHYPDRQVLYWRDIAGNAIQAPTR